jgi:hypothetical protein
MNGAASLTDLKKMHDELYQKALNDHIHLLKNEEQLKAFIARVDAFLAEIEKASAQLTSVDDFAWLTDVILKWQIVFSSVLNIPRNLAVPTPPHSLVAAPSLQFYSEDDLQKWFTETAFQQSLTRKRNFLLQEKSWIINFIPSTPEDMVKDWYDTNVLFASKVLEGAINMAQQLAYQSYWRLETVWLSDVKAAKAYFIWERREDKLIGTSHDSDYAMACDEIRDMLVNPAIKATSEDFDEAKMYLIDRYLNAERGIFDPLKPKADELIRAKAYRIWQTTGETDEDKNWESALSYCRLFYDNILPAVIEGDPERTLLALKAFQLSKAPENRYLIINCFEVALAIYFLDPGVIQHIWRSASGQIDEDGVAISSADAAGWPAARPIPDEIGERLTFDPSQGRVVFQGVMTEAERRALTRRFPEHAAAIENLYRESRLLSRESTL